MSRMAVLTDVSRGCPDRCLTCLSWQMSRMAAMSHMAVLVDVSHGCPGRCPTWLSWQMSRMAAMSHMAVLANTCNKLRVCSALRHAASRYVIAEWFLTDVSCVWHLTFVCQHVQFESPSLREPFLTDVTFVWFFSQVSHLVQF